MAALRPQTFKALRSPLGQDSQKKKLPQSQGIQSEMISDPHSVFLLVQSMLNLPPTSSPEKHRSAWMTIVRPFMGSLDKKSQPFLFGNVSFLLAIETLKDTRLRSSDEPLSSPLEALINDAVDAAWTDKSQRLIWFCRTLFRMSVYPKESIRIDLKRALQQLPAADMSTDAMKLQMRFWAYLAHAQSKLEYLRYASRLQESPTPRAYMMQDTEMETEKAMIAGTSAELELEALAFTPDITPQRALEATIRLHRELSGSSCLRVILGSASCVLALELARKVADAEQLKNVKDMANSFKQRLIEVSTHPLLVSMVGLIESASRDQPDCNTDCHDAQSSFQSVQGFQEFSDRLHIPQSAAHKHYLLFFPPIPVLSALAQYSEDPSGIGANHLQGLLNVVYGCLADGVWDPRRQPEHFLDFSWDTCGSRFWTARAVDIVCQMQLKFDAFEQAGLVEAPASWELPCTITKEALARFSKWRAATFEESALQCTERLLGPAP